jgi:hypothetical protein
MKIDNEYLTKDLGEASAILASGVKVLRIQRESGVCFFVFDRLPATSVSEKYWSGELLIDAKTYNETERSLKTRIFSQQ